MQNEDLPYLSSDITVPDADVSEDKTENRSALEQAIAYIDEVINTHNSFDAIDLSKNSKLTTIQQVAVNKEVVKHLRSIRVTLFNKLEESK